MILVDLASCHRFTKVEPTSVTDQSRTMIQDSLAEIDQSQSLLRKRKTRLQTSQENHRRPILWWVEVDGWVAVFLSFLFSTIFFSFT